MEQFVQVKNNCLVQEGFSEQHNKFYEGLFSQGNGYLHVRGSFEEGLQAAPQDEKYERLMKSVTTEKQHSPLSKCGTYVPLIMGKHPSLEEVIINLPFFMNMSIRIDGRPLDVMQVKLEEFGRSLNLRTGELVRTMVVITTNGSKIEFCFRRFASMHEKHLFVQHLQICCLDGAAQIEVESGIDASATTNGYNHFKELKLTDTKNGIECTAVTDLGFEVQELTADAWDALADCALVSGGKYAAHQYCLDMKTGDTIGVTKCSVIATSRDLPQVCPNEIMEAALLKGYEELLTESQQVWSSMWENADVVVDGNQELQDAIRFSIYHLLRCYSGDDGRFQVCAKGFAGEAYYGRFFWDSEIYLLPFYLYTNPTAARQLVMYRYHTLQGAKENSARYRCRGARYPWQSALGGQEQCTLWEYADNEVHITADVAFAVMHYYKATNDWTFMWDYGLEMLVETARFWMDRVDKDESGNYHLLNVMGPDEYSPMTRDNGFTNRMVRFNLSSAVWIAEEMKQKDRECFEKICDRMRITQNEFTAFSAVAASLPIPYDADRKLYLQSADFEQYAHITLDDYWSDKNKAFGHFVPQEKLYRTRCIKQADTLAMMVLFPQEFSDEEIKVAYDYYHPYTTHDSSLSPIVHAMVTNRLHMEQEQTDYLRLAIAVDLDAEKRGAEEGIHIANCGALWQLVVNGYAGVPTANYSPELKLSPALPNDVSAVRTQIMWNGRRYRIAVTQQEATVTPLDE